MKNLERTIFYLEKQKEILSEEIFRIYEEI